MPRRYNKTLTPAQRATIDKAVAMYINCGCIAVDIAIELNECGIDPYRLIDELNTHPNFKTIH